MDFVKNNPDELLQIVEEDHKEKYENIDDPIYLRDLQLEVYGLLLQKKRSEVSERIVQEFYKKNYIKVSRDDLKPEFKIYKNGIYVDEGKTYIEEFSRKILDQHYSTQILNDIINKISADNKCDFEKLQDERDPYLLATQDILLDLRDHTQIDFSPEIILFNKIPVKYDPNAKCPKILNFLKEILATEDDLKLIFEIIGFSLVNDYFLEKAIMFLGSGRNGKGKLLQLIKMFFGVENTCSVRLQEMNTQSTSICELHNKYVNLAGDLSNTSLRDTGLFKETTGRDPIQAKRKYKNDLKFVNTATHIFACNELPKVYDHSEGFWERWVLINFPYKFVDEKEYNELSEDQKKNKKIKNPNIINDILSADELSGLLNLALGGLKRVQEKKYFSYSGDAEEVKNSWVRQSDSFMAFCMDNLEEDLNNRISKNELRKSYFHYCKKYRLRSSSDKSIKITLENMFGVVEYFDSQERFWEGVKFKDLQDLQGISGITGKKISKDCQKTMSNLSNDEKIFNFLKNNSEKMFSLNDFKENFPNVNNLPEILNKMQGEGVIYSPKIDVWQYLG